LSISEKLIINRLAVVRAYSGDLAGTPVPAQIIAGMTSFSILRFSGSKKHLKVKLRSKQDISKINFFLKQPF
jgi:hypothetical protein